MSNRFVKILPWVIGVLLSVNLILLDVKIFGQQKSSSVVPAQSQRPSTSESTPSSSSQELTECPKACAAEIQQTVEETVASLPLPTAATRVIVRSVSPSPSIKVAYIAIDGSGSTSSMDWVDVPGTDFYFDLVDYPGVKSVRWEVSLRSYLSSDPAYIRLYDVTNKRAIDGSDQMTRSSAYDYIRSSDLTIWRGNNLYRIQAKGSNGNTVNFTSPRLRILLE